MGLLCFQSIGLCQGMCKVSIKKNWGGSKGAVSATLSLQGTSSKSCGAATNSK